jgi:hypothetical protein
MGIEGGCVGLQRSGPLGQRALPGEHGFFMVGTTGPRRPFGLAGKAVGPLRPADPTRGVERFEKSCGLFFYFGAGDGAATSNCSVGVPADEWFASRHRVPRLQKSLNRSNRPGGRVGRLPPRCLPATRLRCVRRHTSHRPPPAVRVRCRPKDREGQRRAPAGHSAIAG